MKRFIVTFIIIFLFFNGLCKSIKIVSCNLETFNDIANSQPRYDLNMDLTGVVIIKGINPEKLELRGNIVGTITKEDNQCIVYVIDGTRSLKLYYPDYLPLDIKFSNFEETSQGIKAGNTYRLELELEKKDKNYGLGSRMLLIKSTELLKKVIMNGEKWNLSDEAKMAKKLLPLGEYEFLIESMNGKTKTGTVEIENGLGNKILNIDFDDEEIKH